MSSTWLQVELGITGFVTRREELVELHHSSEGLSMQFPCQMKIARLLIVVVRYVTLNI